jgi:hypothetical protein
LRRSAFQHFQKGFTKDVMVARTLAVFRDLGMAIPSGNWFWNSSGRSG